MAPTMCMQEVPYAFQACYVVADGSPSVGFDASSRSPTTGVWAAAPMLPQEAMMQQMPSQILSTSPTVSPAHRRTKEAPAEGGRPAKQRGGKQGRASGQHGDRQEVFLNGLKNNAITTKAPPWTDVTTVMMRNLPNKYCQNMLLEEIAAHGFQLQVHFDFFYLPMDHTNAVNLGYCFINFVSTAVANAFASAFVGKRMRKFNSSKTIVVMPASIQGFQRNFTYYSSTRVAQAEDPQFRPIFAPAAAPAATESTAQVSSQAQWYVQPMTSPTWSYCSQVGWPEVPSTSPTSSPTRPGQKLDYDTDEEREMVAAEAGAAYGVLVKAPSAESTPMPEHLIRPDHMVVRNTFIDVPGRPPAADHFAQRQVKSCPASGVHSEAGSARIDVTNVCGQRSMKVIEERNRYQAAALAQGLAELETIRGSSSSSSSLRTIPQSAKPRSDALRPHDGAYSADGSADVRTDSTPSDMDGPVLGSSELPSKGSALHRWSACKPCAFFQQVEQKGGCKNGVECTFCHLCEPGEKKRRKKERQAQKREDRERSKLVEYSL